MSVAGSSHRCAQSPHIAYACPANVKEQPFARAHVAAHVATSGVAAPKLQPIWHEGFWHDDALPVQQWPAKTQRSTQESAREGASAVERVSARSANRAMSSGAAAATRTQNWLVDEHHEHPRLLKHARASLRESLLGGAVKIH